METYLTGKVAIISGGQSGIGLAISKALLKRGAKIAVGSRSQNQLVVDQLKKIGPAVFANTLDVRKTNSVEDFVDQVRLELGPVDILINAAGISTYHTVCGHSDHAWNDVIDTNLTGPFKLTRACLPLMIERNWGRIINIGSTAAKTAVADAAAYCASKSGLLGLTRAVALEGARHGVSCTMISPTWVETEMMQRSMQRKAEVDNTSIQQEYEKMALQTPQNRLVQPDEIAALATFLCRDEAVGITMEDIQLNAGNQW